jgi:kynureninase
LYVAKRWQQLPPVLTGWMGHTDPFAFRPDYEAMNGARRHLGGTPPIVALRVLEAALDLWGRADIVTAAEKTQTLATLAITLTAPAADLVLLTPRAPDQRGGHIAFRHRAAKWIHDELGRLGVWVTFRHPDTLRLALHPLTTRYVDVWDACSALRSACDAVAQ